MRSSPKGRSLKKQRRRHDPSERPYAALVEINCKAERPIGDIDDAAIGKGSVLSIKVGRPQSALLPSRLSASANCGHSNVQGRMTAKSQGLSFAPTQRQDEQKAGIKDGKRTIERRFCWRAKQLLAQSLPATCFLRIVRNSRSHSSCNYRPSSDRLATCAHVGLFIIVQLEAFDEASSALAESALTLTIFSDQNSMIRSAP